jgi:hypothetical protein
MANADIAILLSSRITQLLFFPFLSYVKQRQTLQSASSGQEFDNGLVLKRRGTKERI